MHQPECACEMQCGICVIICIPEPLVLGIYCCSLFDDSSLDLLIVFSSFSILTISILYLFDKYVDDCCITDDFWVDFITVLPINELLAFYNKNLKIKLYENVNIIYRNNNLRYIWP